MHSAARPMCYIALPRNPSPHAAQIPPSSSPNLVLRRDVAFSSLLLFMATLEPSRAETAPVAADKASLPPKSCGNLQDPSNQAFLDVSIDGEPIGRIVIGLYGETVPAGSARFSALVSGEAGVSYRRKDFVKITPNYVQHSGIRSYGVDAEISRKKTGGTLNAGRLEEELERQNENCEGTKNVASSVSIIVRDPLKLPPKLKLVAQKGKLEIGEEQVGTDPNGTEFVIATRDSPELDGSALVVGRVMEGMDVVEKIGRVKTVQDNTSSPYFRVAKLIGDKRAVVAERGFNRPYSKVAITNCGVLMKSS